MTRVPVLVVVAHPDDEVLGASHVLRAAARDVWIAHTTNGAPPDGRDARAAGFDTAAAYARARAAECEEALALAGIRAPRRLCCGFEDQLTARSLVELTRSVGALLGRTGSRLIVTHAYEGGHPDHDATAFAVQLAVKRAQHHVDVLEFPEYHWRSGALEVGTFPAPRAPEIAVPLLGSAREAKRRMLACYRTQGSTLAAVTTWTERYRWQPEYDFTEPPHAGPCYEWFEWRAARGAAWRARARDALEVLGP